MPSIKDNQPVANDSTALNIRGMKQRLTSSITIKLMFSFLFVAVIPLYSLMLLSRYQTYAAFHEEYATVISSVSQKQGLSLATRLQDIEDASVALSSNAPLFEVLMNYGNSPHDIARLGAFKGNIMRQTPCTDVRFYLDVEARNTIVYPLSAMPAVNASLKARTAVWRYSASPSGWVEYVNIFQYEGRRFAFSLLMSDDDIAAVLALNEVGQGNYYLIDQNSTVIATNDQINKQTQLTDEAVSRMLVSGTSNIYEKRAIYIKDTIGNRDLYLIRKIKDDRLTSSIDASNRVILYISYVLLVFIIVASIFYSRGLLRRILGLETAIRHNRPYHVGSRKPRTKKKSEDGEYFTGDEIDRLIFMYNEMHNKIDNLIKDVYIAETEKSKSQLAMMQAQINPHFLYNVLDSIKSCLDCKKYEDTRKMIITLALFYRTCLSGGMEVIPIKREFQMIAAYVDLEKMCYGDFFDIDYHFDDSIQDFLIIKFTLQPVLENAINHGLRAVSHRGLIQIDCRYEGDYIDIQIRDNGCGISAQKLEEITAGLAEEYTINEKGYGLRNVNSRMKLYYGEGCGIRRIISSTQGTTVILRIPQDV